MKSILIIGASNAGKSTTMREVCRRLSPSKVYSLSVDKTNLENSRIELSDVEKIFNDTFIIQVRGRWILVVAGAPTEQNITLTILIEICITIKIDISFALVSMRSFEKRPGFNTPSELKNNSEILMAEKIYKIDAVDFVDDVNWNKRIERIVNIITSNI